MRKLLELALIKQFGAIKPPWKHVDTFYKLPFNFCDRWCERCRLSKICRVYQTERKRYKEFIKQEINPRSTKAMLLSITKDFEETRKLIEENIKRLNITEKELEELGKREDEMFDKAEKDPLYKISLKLALNLHKFIEDLYLFYLDIPPYLEETIIILKYYFYFFPSKVWRAISSFIEEEHDKDDMTLDSKNSAFLAYTAIIKLVNALKNYSKVKDSSKELKQEAKKLTTLLTDLKMVLDKKFELNFF